MEKIPNKIKNPIGITYEVNLIQENREFSTAKRGNLFSKVTA
jgi:hypothetical protein